MSHAYKAVGWNRQKKVYDATLAGGIVMYLVIFIVAGALLRPNMTVEALLIRGFGTAAILMLHIVLSIGPLARLDRRFLPMLYNRRHMGVMTFLLAAVHGVFSIIQFHALGDMNPIVSVLSSNTHYSSVPEFPFQSLGLIALTILFLMAATSHDFWLANLSAPVWKTLHMLVYLVYALVVAHVVLGVLQAETSPVLATLLGAGVMWVLGLHVVAGWRERRLDVEQAGDQPGFVDVCCVDEIPENQALVFTLSGERVAVFRYDNKVSAVSAVCQHQNGPLGEGCVIDGLITCPWHGYQYRPDTGESPAPFTERVPTFNVRIAEQRVLVDRLPNPAGTRVTPAQIDA